MEFLTPLFDEIKKDGDMKPGDDYAFVLRDAVVFIDMDEDRQLNIRVALNPIHMDLSTGLTGEGASGDGA